MSSKTIVMTENVKHLNLKPRNSVLETEDSDNDEEEQDTAAWAIETLKAFNETVHEQHERINELHDTLQIKDIMLEELSRKRKQDIKEMNEKYENEIQQNSILQKELNLYRKKDTRASSTRAELNHYLSSLGELKNKSENKRKAKEKLYEEALKDLEKYY